MTPFMQEHLEEYLSGELSEADLERFEREASEDPAAAEAIAAFSDTRELFDAVRAPEGVEPAPGFYSRLSARIDEERQTPFWAAFLQPFFVRRVAFAALMWMFLLGSAALLTDDTTERSMQLADTILEQQPPTDNFYVRMGSDLERNRNTMLHEMLVARAE